MLRDGEEPQGLLRAGRSVEWQGRMRLQEGVAVLWDESEMEQLWQHEMDLGLS